MDNLGGRQLAVGQEAGQESAVQILVADDDGCQREFVSSAFERVSGDCGVGVDLIEAQNGPEVVRWVARGGIQLVVSDVMMIGGNGPEAVSEFIDSPDSPHVVMMSGRVSPEQVPVLTRLFSNPKFLGVFPKPLSLESVGLLLTLASTRGQIREDLADPSSDPGQIRQRILDATRVACEASGMSLRK